MSTPSQGENPTIRTPAERLCLESVRKVTAETDGVLERHSLRCCEIAERLAVDQALDVDRELLLCAALLHDIGLYDGASRGGPYVSDGSAFAAELLEPFAWAPDRLRRCMDAIERHHELRPQWDRGVEVELLRRADLVELSGGLVSFGLKRAWLDDLARRLPRDGLYRGIGGLVAHMLRERPLTMARIFRPS